MILAPGASSGGSTGKMSPSEMNDTSMVTMFAPSPTSGQIARTQMPGVGAFDHRDARIAADLPVQLRVPDVQGNDMARAALQEHIGEAAGRGADVEAPSRR